MWGLFHLLHISAVVPLHVHTSFGQLFYLINHQLCAVCIEWE